MSRALLAALLLGCQEYQLQEPPIVPVADPPGSDEDEFGSPPDWQDCTRGYLGQYSNLSVDHPHVDPTALEAEAVPTDYAALDWWEEPSFQKFDPSLDFGANWWPVDEGLEHDPRYFAVRWVAWMRIWSSSTLEITLGSADDAWVTLDNEVVISSPGIQSFEPVIHYVSASAGQAPLEIRYAHRAGGSGFRFRVIEGDISICYPDFSSTGP